MRCGERLPYRNRCARTSIVSFLAMAHCHSVALAAPQPPPDRLFPEWCAPVVLGIPLIFLLWRLFLLRRQVAEERAARAEVERALAARTAQLEASARELEGIGYSVSHDLRAPLRAIDGFSRMLEEDYGERLDAEGRRLLQVVRNNSYKLSRMIEHVLAYSRIGRAHLSTTDIDMQRLAGDALREIGAAGGALPIVVGELPRAHGDAGLVREALVHVLANAVKFSAAREPPIVEVTGREEGGESIYRVRDNGVGFDTRYYEKLFQLFQRLHPEDQFPGEGVGLSMAQRIVVRHGGRLWAESSPGAGATFFIALPSAGDGDGLSDARGGMSRPSSETSGEGGEHGRD